MTCVGQIDDYSPTSGISGWAFDAKQPDGPLKLGLYFDDVFVVATIAALPRPDVMEQHPECNGFCGFRFSPLDFLPLASMRDVPDNAVANVRTLHADEPLYEAVDMPTSFSARAACEAAIATGNQEGAGPPAYASLVQRLKHYRRLAALAHPVARYREVAGFVETVASLNEETIMLGGWLTDDQGTTLEGPGFLFADELVPCGVSIASFPHNRHDLPQNARQFVATVQGSWLPSPDSRLSGGVQLASGSGLFLQAIDRLSYVAPDVFDEQLQGIADASGEMVPPTVQQLRSLLYHAGEFVSSKGAGPIRCGLDLLVSVPNFGFVVTGWMLLGREKLVSLEMRQGSTLIPAVPRSLAFSPRPDLAAPYPRENVDRAGFAAAFECHDEVLPHGPLQLRMEFAGGRKYVMEVEPDQVATIQSVGDLAKIGKVYPDIDAEDFGPDMRAALAGHFQHSMELLSVAAPKEVVESYLVVLLPADESLCRLYLACAGRLTAHLPESVGVCLLAAGGGARRALRQWLHYEPNLARRASAAFIVSEHFTLHHVPRLLQALPMQRFAICLDPPIFEEEMEAAIADFLHNPSETPMAVVNDGRRLRVLATTRDRIETYVAIAPFRFRKEDFTVLRVLGHRFVRDDAIELTPEKRATDFVDHLDAMVEHSGGERVAI